MHVTALVGLWKRIKYLASLDPSYEKLRSTAKDPQSPNSEWQGVVIDSGGRIFVPADDELRMMLIAENHDGPLNGHFGAERTQELVERYWVWQGLARDVREYVRSCRQCQLQKHSTRLPPGKLHPIVATHPWQVVTLDLVGGLPASGKPKYDYILVMVDKFSKYVCLEPCHATLTAPEAAEIFLRRIVAEHGIPQVVISDRGPQFSAALWQHVLKLIGSKAGLAATHHPQTDGQSERSIQTLLRLVRTFAHQTPVDWSSLLPFLQFAMNNAPSSSTRYSPFQVLYGRTPVTPADLWKGHAPIDPPTGVHQTLGVEAKSVALWLKQWWKARKKLRTFVHAHLKLAAERMKSRYDSGRQAPDLRTRRFGPPLCQKSRRVGRSTETRAPLHRSLRGEV